MKDRLLLPSVALLALGVCAGCGNEVDGDWDGTVNFLSVNGDVTVRNGPVHVHVQNGVLSVTGAPFTQCTAKMTGQGKDLKLDWSGGTCKFNGRKYMGPDKGKVPTEFAVGEGAGTAGVSDGKLAAHFVPANGSTDPIDAAFDIAAHRPGK